VILDLARPRKRALASDGWPARSVGGRVRTNAGTVVDENLALTYSAAWGCSRLLSETIGGLPVFVYRRKPNDDRLVASEHPAYDMLRVAPNPTMGANAFRVGRTLHQINWGNGLAEIEREKVNDPKSPLLASWPIHPGRVRCSRPGDRYEEGGEEVPSGSYLVRNNDGTTTTLRPWEVLHFPGALTEDGIWGKSVIQHARETIGFGLGVERHGSNYFGTGAQPKGLISTPGVKDKQTRDDIRREWKTVYGGDSGEVAIFPPETTYTPFFIPNNDSQFLETLVDGDRRMSQWYGVPLHMLSNLANGASYATVEQLSIEFVIYRLMPWVKAQESQLNLKLLTPQERRTLYIEFEFAGLLRGDYKSRMDAYRLAIMAGIMSINEVRHLENLNGIGPAGDVYYVAINLTTADRMAEGDVKPGAGSGSDMTGAAGDGAAALAIRRRQIAAAPKATGDADADLRRIDREISGQARHVLPDLGAQRAAARGVLVQTLGWLFAKEGNAAQRAAESKGADFDRWLAEFYPKHEKTAAEALGPACAVLASIGTAADAGAWAARLAAESRLLLTTAYNETTPAAFKAMVSAWPTERAAQTADAILGETP
jgi:HK97 family phage portal protein